MLASLSLDLDNKWSYLKTHGDVGWETFPSYLGTVVPRVLQFLSDRQLRITFFVVGQDAAIKSNHAVLRSIAEAGHEIGNHSFHHEPWLHLYSPADIARELGQTEEALLTATSQQPCGFRGPGFSFSPELLDELARRGYEYDCSTFPTFLGPVARLYYFFTARLSPEQKRERKQLFGTAREGFRSLRPYFWKTAAGPLVEIPVTTMPVFKIPIHVSYLLYLAQFSRPIALLYWRFALGLCRLFRVEPSLLLHPLDFLGCDDGPDLGFFPVMNKPAAWKVEFVGQVIDQFRERFEVLTVQEHARRCRERLA